MIPEGWREQDIESGALPWCHNNLIIPLLWINESTSIISNSYSSKYLVHLYILDVLLFRNKVYYELIPLKNAWAIHTATHLLLALNIYIYHNKLHISLWHHYPTTCRGGTKKNIVYPTILWECILQMVIQISP